MSARIRHCLLVSVALLLAPAIGAVPALAAPSALQANPASFAYADQDIHSGPQGQQFDFGNSSGADVFVSAVAISGPDASQFTITSDGCSTTTVSDPGSCAVRVDFTPTTPGPKSATLQLTDGVGATADAALSGTVRTGALTASTPSFQPQPYYYGDPQAQLTLTNSSPSWQVRGTSYSLTGPDASRFYISNSEFCFTLLYGAGNTCTVSVSMHSAPTGTYHAALEVHSDGTADPPAVPLDVTELGGPHLVITPGAVAFGAVELGQDSVQALTLANAGDAPLQIGESFVVTGRPEVFFVTANGCAGQLQLDPGASCQMLLHFKPGSTGAVDASLFVITGNQPEPVTPLGINGTGVLPPPDAPHGSASLTGSPIVGGRLVCRPVGYSADAGLAYRWLRDGHALALTAPTLRLHDADVGARFACELTASSAGGTQTVSSPGSAPVAPRDLAYQRGALVAPASCRRVVAARRLSVGGRSVSIGYGRPVTALDALTVASHTRWSVAIDGRVVDSGRRISIGPDQLAEFGDGLHRLTVSGGGHSGGERILLSGCRLALRVRGGARRTTTIEISPRYGMSAFTIALPAGLRLHPKRGWALGVFSAKPAGLARRLLGLVGADSHASGLRVRLSAHRVRVTGLPPQTGLVGLRLRAGVVSGRGGAVRVTTTLRGDGASTSAHASSDWRLGSKRTR